jgi:hypothetical protein
MATRFARLDGFARARYLRGAGHVATALWALGWVVFGVLIAIRASADLVSAVAALICIAFAASFGLQVAAHRIALRELRVIMARDDLVASRSRGRARIRNPQRNLVP